MARLKAVGRGIKTLLRGVLLDCLRGSFSSSRLPPPALAHLQKTGHHEITRLCFGVSRPPSKRASFSPGIPAYITKVRHSRSTSYPAHTTSTARPEAPFPPTYSSPSSFPSPFSP